MADDEGGGVVQSLTGVAERMLGILSHSFESTALSRATYERSTGTLNITFKGGREYTYEDVPLSVYEGLIDASSAGAYFNQFIRDQYGD